MTLNIQVHLLQIMGANASLRWTELNEQKSTSRKSWCILTKSRCAVQLPHPSLQDVQLRKNIEEMENIVLSTKRKLHRQNTPEIQKRNKI